MLQEKFHSYVLFACKFPSTIENLQKPVNMGLIIAIGRIVIRDQNNSFCCCETFADETLPLFAGEVRKIRHNKSTVRRNLTVKQVRSDTHKR